VQYIKLSRRGRVGIVTIDRPEALNALNPQVLDELGEAVEEFAADPGVDVLVITGAGEKAFVAGADIKAMRDMTPLEAREFARKGQRVLFALESCPKPVIAAVNGYALGGGCELALACDLRYASERAVFGQPEVKLGVPPGFGGTQRLPRLVGRARAKEMIFTGDNVDARQAEAMGLVNAVFPAEELMERVLEVAERIASRGQLAVRAAKAAINRGTEVDLVAGCDYEAEAFALCFATEDQKEGMSAFIDKRRPQFKGK